MCRSTLSLRFAKLLASTALAALLGCAINPVTGKRELSLMSESQEISLGQSNDPAIVAEFGLYDDDKLATYVNEIGQRMAKLSHRPYLPFTFRVLDSPVINAFALPGGYVYITRGILAHMNNEAELAVVLGHEIGHVTARHGAKRYSQQTLAGLGLGLGSVFVPEVARFGQLAEQALGLLFLKYGRDDENEADRLGVEYSLKAGYDPEVGAKFFEVLDRQQQESGQSLPNWLSTHPAPADRVQETAALSRELKVASPGAQLVVAEASHKKRVDGMVFGDNPRHGFVDGNTFKHPDLEFQVSFPSGWAIYNMPTAVVAQEKNKSAVLQMTLEESKGLQPEAYVRELATKASVNLVGGGRERIGGYSAFVGEVVAQTESGTQRFLLAAIQQKDNGPMFQFVGAAASLDRWRTGLVESVRSFKRLTEPGALNIEPNHVRLETVGSDKTVASAVAAYSDVPVPLGTIALINNLQTDTLLPRGFQLKVVRGTYKRAP